jgi:hypothetical protein
MSNFYAPWNVTETGETLKFSYTKTLLQKYWLHYVKLMKEPVTFGTRGSVVCRGAMLEAEKVVDLNPVEATVFSFQFT